MIWLFCISFICLTLGANSGTALRYVDNQPCKSKVFEIDLSSFELHAQTVLSKCNEVNVLLINYSCYRLSNVIPNRFVLRVSMNWEHVFSVRARNASGGARQNDLSSCLLLSYSSLSNRGRKNFMYIYRIVLFTFQWWFAGWNSKLMLRAK